VDSVSIVSAVVAVAGAGLAAFFSYWQQRRLSVWEKHNYMERYGASLAWAVFDLQSRLYNILHGQVVDRSPGAGVGYLTAYLGRGTPAEAEYARRSTVFVLAEYLAWAEVLRRDIQFLNLGGSRINRKIMGQISQISSDISDMSGPNSELRLFRAHQRAIGELMVHPDSAPGQRWCLGYAEFCQRLDHDNAFLAWFAGLLGDVDRLAIDTVPAVPRLQKIQNELVALIDLLDPKAVRFPQFRRAFDSATHAVHAPSPSAPPQP
jgi:hypothetical protein